MPRHAAPRRRNFWAVLRSARLRALLSLGLVLGVGATGTMAYWSDNATVSGATFTAGTLDLQLNDEVDDDYAFTTLNASDLIPGSSVAATLNVQNKSQGASFTYAMSASATNGDGKNLAGTLTLIVRAGGTSTGTTCTGGTAVISRTGLAGGAVTFPNTLAPSGADSLCFQVGLPAGAPASVQGASTAATFTVNATQAP